MVNRVGSVHATKRNPTAAADPVWLRISQDIAVWNSQTVTLLALVARRYRR